MVKSSFAHFRSLRPSVRALLYLFWVFALTGSLSSTFLQIYLYTQYQSLSFNIIASLVFFTGIAVGFCLCGYWAGKYRINIVHGFWLSLFIQGASFALLAGTPSEYTALSFTLMFGVGNGLFWLTIHSYELARTLDAERDIYSSLLIAGSQAIEIVGPALATFLIWISGSLLGWGSFVLLFATLPLIYALGFFFLRPLGSYVPAPINRHDVRHFLQHGKNRFMHLYFASDAIQHILAQSIFPLAALLIIGTVVKVGIYSTAAGFISVLGVLLLAQYRSHKNRLQLLGIGTAILTVAVLWLGYSFSFSALLIFTIVAALVRPVLQVSSHLIHLQTIEGSGRKESDFFATMVLRDFSLWIWRMIGGGSLLLFISLGTATREGVAMGIYLFAAMLITSFVAAYFLLKSRSRAKDAFENAVVLEKLP